VFAGKECARALALMSTSAADCSADLSGLSDEKLQILGDWERKFQSKYTVVGSLAGSGLDLTTHQQPEPDELPPIKGRTGPHPLVLALISVAVAAASFAFALSAQSNPEL